MQKQPTKEELARRIAQSQRDKKAAGKPFGKPGGAKKKPNKRIVMVPSAPAAKPIKASKASVANVLRAFIDPDHADPIRLPGGAPTFVNKLRAKFTAGQPPSGAYFQQNSGFAIVRRDPRLGLIVSEYKGTGNSSTYRLVSQAVGGALVFRVGNQVVPALAQHSAGYDRHDDFMVPVTFRDRKPRVWFQTETATPSQLVFTNLTPSVAHTFVVTWLADGVLVTDNVAFTTDGVGAFTFTFPSINRTGYFEITFTSGPQVLAGNLSLVDNSKNIIRHLPVPELANSATDVDNMRVNAASLMCSDRSTAFNSQGDVCSYQAGGGEDWTCVAGVTADSNLSLDPYAIAKKSQKPFTNAYKKGKYMPLKLVDNPQEQVMLEMFDDGDPESISPIDMTLQTDYIYMGYNCGAPQGDSGGNPFTEWTAVWAVEGETESQWKSNKIPHMHPDVLKEARYVFSQQECDFENISHLKKVWDWVKRNAPKVLGIVEGASAALPPQYRAAVMGGAQLARQAIDFADQFD